MGQVMLAVFSQIFSISINHSSGVIKNACHFFFVHRNNNNHVVLFCQLLHEFGGGAIRDFFNHIVPPRFLLGTKIRTVEQFLQTQDLYLFLRRFFDQYHMLFEHGLFNLIDRIFSRTIKRCLYQSSPYNSCHNIEF